MATSVSAFANHGMYNKGALDETGESDAWILRSKDK